MQFWSSYLQKNITELGKVQRRAAKMVRGLEPLPEGKRPKGPGAFPVEERGNSLEGATSERLRKLPV